MRTARTIRMVATGFVLLHFFVASVHGIAHQRIGVGLESWQEAFVGGVILVGPLVALGFIWTSQWRLGSGLLTLFMAGSAAFGICYHFLLPGTDNVFSMAKSEAAHWFTITAVALAILETSCAGCAFWMLRSERARAG